MTTYSAETHNSVTHSSEISGADIRCNSTVIYCNNEDYDCCGNRIFGKDVMISTTYNNEVHS